MQKDYESVIMLDDKMLDDIKSYSADMLPKIIQTYISSADEYLGELEKAISERSCLKLQKKAHSIKSISGQIGAKRVYTISSDLEETCLDVADADVHWGNVNQLKEVLEKEIIAVKAALQKHQ